MVPDVQLCFFMPTVSPFHALVSARALRAGLSAPDKATHIAQWESASRQLQREPAWAQLCLQVPSGSSFSWLSRDSCTS